MPSSSETPALDAARAGNRVATSACLDAADKQKARALPMSLRPRSQSHEGMTPDLETPWLEPKLFVAFGLAETLA